MLRLWIPHKRDNWLHDFRGAAEWTALLRSSAYDFYQKMKMVQEELTC
jgi:hypothetical protein